MSTSRQNGAGGVQAIPAGSRKIVQTVKEIVNCPEAEIYAALKECNMDPNEAVSRLLNQDPFREVKSKREKKKKEGKEATDSRPRGGGNASSRGGRAGSERYHSRGSSVPYSSSESTNFHGKTTSYPKENGSNPRLSSTTGSWGITRNREPPAPVLGDSVAAENKGLSWGTADVAQTPSGSTWGGGRGQMSMADIVKMGRPQHGKPFNGPNASHQDFQGPPLATSHNDLKTPKEHALKENWSEHSSVQPRSTIDEWPSIEKPATVQVASVSGFNAEPEQHHDSSFGKLSDEIEAQDTDDEKSGETSPGKNPEDGPRGVSMSENNLYEATSSYEPQGHNFEHHEVEDVDATVSSVARNLQKLKVDTEERNLSSEEYAPSVVIPEHLQVQSADLSHLSFGSFGSGMNISYSSGIMTSTPAKSQLDKTHIEDDVPPAELQETRKSEYYADDSLRDPSDGSFIHGSGTDAGSYDPSSASKQEELKPANAELAHGNQYPFPPSNQGYTFDDAHHLNTSVTQTSSNLQNLAPLSNVMQSYNTMPSTLSAAGVHPNREADLHYSPFPGTQSMPEKYANSVSTMDSSTISMSEALKTAGISSTQPAPQTAAGTNIATGPPLPQHLAMHPYSQPTLPLGPFTNIMGYPFLPQSYTYLPSAFQQAFAGNNAYHQSLASAAALPQYKSSVSANSLPQSAAIPSGYGAFGNASTMSSNFPMNPPSAPSGTNLSYEELLNSQYKDNSHLASLSQNENPAMWLQGHNSRTVPAIPGSTYYNYPGQSQQPSGFRQGQQPSQNYGALGYANFYHSQAGLTHDQQQTNARDASLGGAQGQPKQPQIWQNNY